LTEYNQSYHQWCSLSADKYASHHHLTVIHYVQHNTFLCRPHWIS